MGRAVIEFSFDSTGSGGVAGSISPAYPDWPTAGVRYFRKLFARMLQVLFGQ